ncbi:C2 domain-containing protein [Dichotomocladium elegans]|nr:C2 domain-containing protein [Dichotomocladium elegans]
MFEPLMSAYVIENIDTYLVDYLPGFLDSVRLTTFTLGTKPVRVQSVRWIQESDADTVCMDWAVSFKPSDTSDMNRKQLEKKVNPKVILTIRLGKGMVGAGIPVLVENMSFQGLMRVKLKFMSKFPHVKMVEACFLQKPEFDYVLKPIGGETFGLDVTNIPGLQSFVRDQVHAILGPMMYYPNVFSFDVDKFFSGELDITQANGVLAVTVYSTTAINAKDISGSLNPYIRFYLDKAQELGRSSVQENTLEPRWNETHFLMLNNLKSVLSFELRNQQTESKDRRIARGHFNLSNLNVEEDYCVEGYELDLMHNGNSLSQLKVDMRYMPVSKAIARDDGTVEPPVESNSGILRFTVHECRNLESVRLNPYVRVMINGTERIKTPVFKRNANPKFERSGEVVVLDQTAVYIRVEVKDSISFAEDSTVGVWKCYLVEMMQQLKKNDGWWDLTHDDGRKTFGRIRLSVQWKPVVMSGLSEALGGYGIYNPPIGIVRITFWRARNLKNVEGVASKSDPYVRVMSGSQVRTRTSVIDNNLDPEWGETQYVPVHSDMEDLKLEVMDWEAKIKDRSLGFTVLHMKELVKHVITETDDWYESTGNIIDQWVPLRSANRSPNKGELQYTAEFFPTLDLPEQATDGEEEHHSNQVGKSTDDSLDCIGAPTVFADKPATDLHGVPVKYTPDDLVDLMSYNSGVLTVKIHEVKLPIVATAYCQLAVDSLLPQFHTAKIKGRTLTFNEAGDAFVKEADFSRVAVEIKSGDLDEKEDEKLGYWVEPVNAIIRRIQSRRRSNEKNDDGDWFELMGTSIPGGQIRLSFSYTPVVNFTLNPNESLDNQGQLTVTLLKAHDLMAVNKSGTSDPYVVFTVNGERKYKSTTIKKTRNPVWNNESFIVPIQSRVIASFRIEVFDWNKFSGDVPLGSGGISLRGDFVESFVAKNVNIPLDGVAGVDGYVQVRLLWKPQLLIRKKTHTSVLGDQRTYTNMGLSNTSCDLSSTSRSSSFFLPPSKSSSSISKAAGALPLSFPSLESITRPSPPALSTSTSRWIPTSNASRPRSDSQSSSVFEQRTSIEMSNDDTLSQPETSAATGLNGSVTITLIEARSLVGVDKGGTSDPFARVIIGKKQVYKTKHMKKTLAPLWNESFSCYVSSQPTMMNIKVKDYNRFSNSVELGQYEGNVWDLLRPQDRITVVDRWLPLYPEGQGDIHVKIEFTQQ